MGSMFDHSKTWPNSPSPVRPFAVMVGFRVAIRQMILRAGPLVAVLQRFALVDASSIIGSICALVGAIGVGAVIRSALPEGETYSGAAIAATAVAALFLLGHLLIAIALPRDACRILSLITTSLVVLAAAMALLGGTDRGASRLALFGQIVLTLTATALIILAALRLVVLPVWRVGQRALAEILVDWRWIQFTLGIVALTLIYVEGSHRVLFWDPMNYWLKTDQVADIYRAGLSWSRVIALLATAADEYSMIPALLPALVNVQFQDGFLLGYMVSVAVTYVIPAFLTAGFLGLLLAQSVVPDLGSRTFSERIGLVTFGALGVVALLPRFLLVFLQDVMLDIGGIVVLVPLALAWGHLLKLVLKSDSRHAVDMLATASAVAFLSLLLFVFRRWYIFDVIGFALAAFTFLLLSLRSRIADICRNAALVGGGMLLATLTGGSYVLVRWIIDWKSRQYSESYAAYWWDWQSQYHDFVTNFGLTIPVLASLAMVYFLIRGKNKPLPFVLLVGTVVGCIAFRQVQSTSPQHYYLIMPLLGGGVAGGVILAAHRIGSRLAFAAVLVLGWLVALAPRQESAWALLKPSGVSFLPRSSPDVLPLLRLGEWINGEVKGGEMYCVAASSILFNGSIMKNLWQLDRNFLDKPVVTQLQDLGDVDTRDGPPDTRTRRCAVFLAADPPQWHLRLTDQRSILMLNEDLLTGTGIGAAYARLPGEFRLVSGATIVGFRTTRPLTDAEMTDLRRRFYEGKGAQARRYQERFGTP